MLGAAGARISACNDDGHINGAIDLIANNTFKGIVTGSGYGAYGLKLAGFGAGTGIIFQGNTLESNVTPFNIGDKDSSQYTQRGITMIGNTIKKSSDGAAGLYNSIVIGDYQNTVTNVRMIDTQYANGATSTVTFKGTMAKDISFGYTLSVTVVDASGNPVNGAAVSITGQNGNMVYSGATGSDGMIGVIPLLTRTCTVLQNGNDSSPTVTSTSGLTVRAKSGTKSGVQSLTLSGDQSVQVVVQ